MSDEDEDSYITVEEAAQILQISTRQVRRYASGEKPRIRKRQEGRFVGLHQGDVAALAHELEQGTRSATRSAQPDVAAGESLSPHQKPTQEQTDEQVDSLAVGELVTLKEAAAYSGLSIKSLYDYIRRGRLKARKFGAQWVTTRAAIDQYLASRSLQNIPKKHRRSS
jgi:excisionase family DNA binding protein